MAVQLEASELKRLADILALVLDDHPEYGAAALDQLRRMTRRDGVTAGALKSLFQDLMALQSAMEGGPEPLLSTQRLLSTIAKLEENNKSLATALAAKEAHLAQLWRSRGRTLFTLRRQQRSWKRKAATYLLSGLALGAITCYAAISIGMAVGGVSYGNVPPWLIVARNPDTIRLGLAAAERPKGRADASRDAVFHDITKGATAKQTASTTPVLSSSAETTEPKPGSTPSQSPPSQLAGSISGPQPGYHKQIATLTFAAPAVAAAVTGPPLRSTIPQPTTAAGRQESTSGPPVGGMSPALVAELISLGNAKLALGDVYSARLLYQRAAASGSPQAMVSVGRTYDPRVLAAIRAVGIPTDAQTAVAWYRKAAVRGNAEAIRLLQQLQ